MPEGSRTYVFEGHCPWCEFKGIWIREVSLSEGRIVVTEELLSVMAPSLEREAIRVLNEDHGIVYPRCEGSIHKGPRKKQAA